MSERTLIVVGRHGRTYRNSQNLLLSRFDDPLTPVGKAQAFVLQRKLRQYYPFSGYYSSPLSRAYETAEIVAKRNHQIIIDDRIIERHYGDLEGQPYIGTKEERQHFLENQPHSWTNNPHDIEPDGKLEARIIPFFREVAVSYLGIGPVFVSTHSGVMRFILNSFGFTYSQMQGKQIPNCGYIVLASNGSDVNIVEVDDRPKFQWLKNLFNKTFGCQSC